MKLTTKGNYGISLMLDILKNASNGPVRLADVSQRTGISLHYLEQLARKIRTAGFIKSIRGPGGGYIPAKAPAEISVMNLFNAVGEKYDFAGAPWLATVVEDALSRTTIASCAKNAEGYQVGT